MLSKTGFTHSDLLCWQIDYAGGALNVNGTIMRDTYSITGIFIIHFFNKLEFNNDRKRQSFLDLCGSNDVLREF